MTLVSPDFCTIRRNVAAVAARFAIEMLDITAEVDDGTVYSAVAVVAAGFDCPSTLYELGIDYAPISKNASKSPEPAGPVGPVMLEPVTPVKPVAPVKPVEPVFPVGPVAPVA